MWSYKFSRLILLPYSRITDCRPLCCSSSTTVLSSKNIPCHQKDDPDLISENLPKHIFTAVTLLPSFNQKRHGISLWDIPRRVPNWLFKSVGVRIGPWSNKVCDAYRREKFISFLLSLIHEALLFSSHKLLITLFLEFEYRILPRFTIALHAQ